MPIPLAHPAAVLPLRRYCHRWLSFSSLVIGSLAPDVYYFFSDPAYSTLSHEFVGSIAFGLPVGLLGLGALYTFRRRAVEMLPERHRQIYRPLCKRPIAPLYVILPSLIIGILSHVVWDSFVHIDGAAVEYVPLLKTVVIAVHGRSARLLHVLWYLSSFGGVAILYYSFDRWERAAAETAGLSSSPAKLRDALVLAALLGPIALIHHLFNNPVGIAVTVLLSTLLVFRYVFAR